MRRATRGAAGPIIPLPARVVIASEGQVARVAAPPVPERTDLDLDGEWVNPLSLEWSPAAATPPKAPATVPRPAPTYEQQIEIVGPKSETCRPGSAQCGGLKIRASAALPPNTAAATILPPFIISLFCLLLSQSPSPGFGLRPHKSSFATTLAVAGIDVALLLVGTILIICVSRPPCFASSDSCVRSSPTISPISSFPQPCSLQQTSHTTSPFVPTYGSIDKLFLIISPAILAVPPSVRDVFTLDLRRIHLTRLLVR